MLQRLQNRHTKERHLEKLLLAHQVQKRKMAYGRFLSPRFVYPKPLTVLAPKFVAYVRIWALFCLLFVVVVHAVPPRKYAILTLAPLLPLPRALAAELRGRHPSVRPHLLKIL